jgi:hypothetical protein
MTTIAIRLLPLLAVLALLLAPAPRASAQLFPPKATVHDELYYVLHYRCPYPSTNFEPAVFWEGNRLVIEVVTSGNVCFTGNDEELRFAVRLGKLPAGDHDLEIRHFFETSASVDPFAGQPMVRRIRVSEQTPVRASGLWFDPAVPQQGLSFLLTPGGELVANWFTYAPSGDPVWLTGQTQPEALEASIEMALASGGRFASAGGNPQLTPFGTLEVTFLECGKARAQWRSTVPGFTNRNLNLVQLSSADGLGNCVPDAITEWLGWR